MNKKILIVDDETSARFLIKLMLKGEYLTDTADDCKSALSSVTQNNYDLILMDINLGKSDSGITTLKKIREINGYEKIPVIAVTAFAFANDKSNLLKAGFNGYISKPFEKIELLNVIYNCINAETNTSK